MQYVYRRKTELTENGNFRLCAANVKRKRLTIVCFLRIAYTYIYIYIHISAVSNAKRKMEDQAIFLDSFTVYSLCKRKFVVCPFVYKETKGSYPFANGLTGLAHLCYLKVRICPYIMSDKKLL